MTPPPAATASLPRPAARLARAARAAGGAGRAWAALALVHAVTTVAGLERLRALLARAGRAPRVPAERRSAVLAETWRTVHRAGRLYPTRVACLQRAAASVLLLRQRGVPAELVIGVQGAPFQAHAWVEVDGVAVGQDAALAGDYTRVTRV